MTQPLIQSLLDTDFYKFTMMQVVLHKFPGAMVEYRFKCRNPGVDLTPYIAEIERELDAFCQLRLSPEELDYLVSQPVFKPDFVDFLAQYSPGRKYIQVTRSREAAGEIDIVVRGPWLQTILFEVPVLAIVNEVYFRNTVSAPDYAEGYARLNAKLAQLDMLQEAPGAIGFKFSDFGTRRRFSRQWQGQVVRRIQAAVPQHFLGTSNVELSRQLGTAPIGTMAHEFLQAAQVLGPALRDFQKFAFETWAQEYRGALGIALSDVVGMDAFLRDFDLYFSKLYDGMRHDSGCPFEWGEKVLRHYERMGIDARTKTMVFSDGLDMAKAINLYQRFGTRARVVFGIGTNLTNDLGYTPLNIVMKMTQCNGQPVAKVSDAAGKTMSKDAAYLAYLKQTFGIEQKAEALA